MQTDSVSTGFCYQEWGEGAGEGPGAGGGQSGGLLGGWSIRPSSDGPHYGCRLAPLPRGLATKCKCHPTALGEAGEVGGTSSVGLTPAVSQTNCSRWKHASECFDLVNNRVLDAFHSEAH